jgi:hypothetical protein
MIAPFGHSGSIVSLFKVFVNGEVATTAAAKPAKVGDVLRGRNRA